MYKKCYSAHLFQVGLATAFALARAGRTPSPNFQTMYTISYAYLYWTKKINNKTIVSKPFLNQIKVIFDKQ